MRLWNIIVSVLSALLFLVIMVEYPILGIVLIAIWVMGVYARWAHSKNRKLRATLRAIEKQLQPLSTFQRDFQRLVDMADQYITAQAREHEREHPAMGTEFEFAPREFSPVENN